MKFGTSENYEVLHAVQSEENKYLNLIARIFHLL